VEEFKQVRENLLDMLEDIDDRLSKISDHTIASDSPPIIDTDKQPNVIENDAKSIHSEINDIKRAISQIDNGTYGICLSCGQAIKRDDSNTSPFSSYCKQCSDK